MLIIISGPPASGKSTTSEELSKRFQRSVYFSLDTIRHFIKGGYVRATGDKEEFEKQLTLAEGISFYLIDTYLKEGYVVIIDHVIGETRYKKYKTMFDDVHGFLLLPTLEALHQRDEERSSEVRMGYKIDELHTHFTAYTNQYFDIIDSTSMKLEEVVDKIYHSVTATE
jgi:adenylate kinase family enzyme